MQSAQAAVGDLLVNSLASNLAVAIVAGVTMENVWQLMNALQVITMIPMLAISVPPQFTAFCQMMLEFASHNILPESWSL